MGGYGNRDGGLGKMIGGLREPVDEDAPRKKGDAPPRRRKPKKEKEHGGKGKQGRLSREDDITN